MRMLHMLTLVVLMIFHFSFVKCDNEMIISTMTTTMPPATTSTPAIWTPWSSLAAAAETPSNATMNPVLEHFVQTIAALFNRFGWTDQNTSSIVNTIRDNVHPRFFTAITAFVNTVRYMARSVYIAYEWNYPELKMSQCLTRHVRREYPELARNINLPNAFKLGHGIFTTLAEYVNEWIYERQNEEEMMENRVGAKVAEVARNPNAVGGYYLPSSYMNVADGSRPFYFSGDRRLVGQVPWVRKRRSLPYSASFGSEVDRRQADDQSYVMTIRKRPVPTPKSETEEVSDAIELEEEDPSFFDLDDMLFGSFGIYTKHMSRYSLPYCSKQYLINAFRRIIPFILGVE